MTLRNSKRATLTVLLGAALPFVCQGQSQPASRPTVTIDIVVTNKTTKEPVTGLKKSEFGFLDDGQPIAGPVSFREISTGQETVRAVILVDALNIRVIGQEYVRSQVEQYLKTKQLRVPTEVAVLADKGIQIQQGFSTDGPGMAAELGKQPTSIRNIPQSTGIYGAQERMDLSVNGLAAILARVAPLPGRTLVLWISPGWPILSGVGIDLSKKQEQAIFRRVVALSTAMREARVTLYAIDPIGAAESVDRATYYENYLKPVRKPEQTDLGDESLQVLAIQSGGLFLNSSAVGLMLDTALADSQHYYEISFPMATTEKPDTFRSVYLQTRKEGLVVRTRDGYYAQP